ncbi:unnamed protein product [Brachionus calyciflorus]|uniref:Uncharacterized protein n=1 Tax=Brachionus calyciflorus TaxID=104777 RepID=A0A813WBT8_9BILA|nr:unnamed protein product [Brachionus calyciflorus]
MRQKFNDSSLVSACLNYENVYCQKSEPNNKFNFEFNQKYSDEMYISQYRFDFKTPRASKNRFTENDKFRDDCRCKCDKCTEYLNDYNLRKQTSSLNRNNFHNRPLYEKSKHSLINCIKPMKNTKKNFKKKISKKNNFDYSFNSNKTFLKDKPQIFVEKHNFDYNDKDDDDDFNFTKIQPIMTSSIGSDLNKQSTRTKTKKTKQTKQKIICSPDVDYATYNCFSNLNINNNAEHLNNRNLINPGKCPNEKLEKKLISPSRKVIEFTEAIDRKKDLAKFYKNPIEKVYQRVFVVDSKQDDEKKISTCGHLSIVCERCVRKVKKDNVQLLYMDLVGKSFPKKNSKSQKM